MEIRQLEIDVEKKVLKINGKPFIQEAIEPHNLEISFPALGGIAITK